MGQHSEGGLHGAAHRAVARCLLAFVCALVLAAPVGAAVADPAAFGDSGSAATADAQGVSDTEADPAAFATSGRTIRVAFPQQASVTWTGDTGKRSGYTYEYLERIAQYTGWDYEFVPVEGSGAEALDESLDKLAQGSVDLVGGVISSPEHRAAFALTRESFATIGVVLQMEASRSDDPLLSVTEDAPLRVAVSECSTLLNDLDAYAALCDLPYTAVTCVSDNDKRAALADGRADVLLSTDMADSGGLRTAARVSSHPLCFAAVSGDTALADDLDRALALIDAVDATFQSQLHDRYFSAAPEVLVLTDEERAYVKSADPVRVGVLTDQPPYQYEETGQLKGIAVDMLEAVSADTGLRFEYVPGASVDELDALLAQGAIDMEAGMDRDYAVAREHGMVLTQPYVSASYVLVANMSVGDGAITGKRLALPASSRYDGEFVGDVHRFASVGECLRAVMDGEADYTYVDEYVMQYFLNTPEFRNVRIAPQTYEPRSVCFGVGKENGGMLLGIVDKALGALSLIDRQAVINGNVLREQPESIADLVQAHPLETFLIVTAVCLVVLLLVLVILFQRARANAKTALDLKKRLRLYALSDDYFFEYDHRADKLILSRPGRDNQGLAEPLTIDFAHRTPVADEHGRTLPDLARSDKRLVEELRLPDADGITHWLRVTVEPVADQTGHAAFSVGKIEVIDDERREKDELVAQAEHDGLTGLLNAATTRQRVEERLAALDADDRSALLIVDIDRFKEANDTYGHLEGDHVLVSVARVLRESFRVGDIVGRLGGDEFMVYLDHVTDEAALKAKCDEVRRTVEHHVIEGTDCRVTVSVGAAFSAPGESFDDLYRRADAALYAAKDGGRNRCGFAGVDGVS